MLIRPFARVVHAPVKAVDIKVHKATGGGGMLHSSMEVRAKLVPDELGPVATHFVTVVPRQVKARSQNQGAEGLGRGISEEGIMQLAVVIALEEQPKGMLSRPV